MIKVLITGANGQVGSALTEQLKKRHDLELFSVSHADLDISNEINVNNLISETNPDVIINAAAYTAVDKAESDSDAAFKVNALASEYLAKASANSNCLLLHISTDYVFDGNKEFPYTEKDKCHPVTVYGKTKLAGEKAIQQYCPRHIILRTAWVFGLHGNNFVKTMIRLSKEKDQLKIVSDQFGSPTYAGDIASTLIMIMDQILAGNQHYGIYHYSGSPYVNWGEFAKQIFHTVGATTKVIPITSQEYPTPAIRPKNSRLNCELLLEKFNIKPSNWTEALKLFKDLK